MVFFFLFFCLIYACNNIFALYYDGGLYFDPKDFFYAECVEKNTDYFYYGNRSISNSESGSQKCENWKEVMEAHHQIFKGYNQFFFPDEYENNSNCRVIKLDKYERILAENNASAHHYVNIDGWQNGPWCYVKNPGLEETKLWNDRFKTPYSVRPCFSLCKGEGREKK